MILSALFVLPARCRDALLIAAGIATLLAFSASAEEPPKPDPLEANLASQWQAAQTGQNNVADAVGKLLEAYRKEKARADAAEAKLKDSTKPHDP